MPKLKTKSAVKKRFSLTGTGKIKAARANKRHRMRNKSQRQIRELRGTEVVSSSEWNTLKKFMPYGS